MSPPFPTNPDIRIPPSMRPDDGRFGSGPSKIRPEAVAALAAGGRLLLGTSHRQPPIRRLVDRIRTGVDELLDLPEDYEVVLGNGGTTAFWDAAAFCLVRDRSQHAVFGEFSSKFAAVTESAPWLGAPVRCTAPPGTYPDVTVEQDVDVYALTHNETSTGVVMPIQRPTSASPDALVLVDATSAAGGVLVDSTQFDVYYFAPQKCLSADGGLWLAAMSPKALDRLAEIRSSGRYLPAFLDLSIALDNSRLNQTYNTPAVSTLLLLAAQLDWINSYGGLGWAAARTADSASRLYGWAESSPVATPFVLDPDARSPVVGTIDFNDEVDAARIAETLRSNGIVDVEPYRKLGRNQLRVAMFPSVDPDDVEALTVCIDFVIDRLRLA